jgi:hypothetical protein
MQHYTQLLTRSVFTFLLAYISCTGVFHCDSYLCAYSVSYLDLLPLSFSLICPPPLITIISTDFNVQFSFSLSSFFYSFIGLFSYTYTKYIGHILHPFLKSKLCTMEAEIGRIIVWDHSGQKATKTPSQAISWVWWHAPLIPGRQEAQIGSLSMLA